MLEQIVSLREDACLCFAMIGDRIAGTVAVARINRPHGEVVRLYLDNTAIEYRGKGVYKPLIKA